MSELLLEYKDYIGYIGFLFVALSLSMKDIKWLRILNLIGAIIFVFYGLYKGDMMPIVILNAYLVIMNVYHLYKLKGSK